MLHKEFNSIPFIYALAKSNFFRIAFCYRELDHLEVFVFQHRLTPRWNTNTGSLGVAVNYLYRAEIAIRCKFKEDRKMSGQRGITIRGCSK